MLVVNDTALGKFDYLFHRQSDYLKKNEKTSIEIPTTILNGVLQIEWSVAVSDFDKNVTKIQNSKKICLNIQNFPSRAMKGYFHKKSVKIRKKKISLNLQNRPPGFLPAQKDKISTLLR